MLILGLIFFVVLVIVHEFGHFIVAKRNGVEVEEFGIGFPPRLYGFKSKKDKTVYSINLLPLGGFVKLKGETDADTEPGSYGASSLWAKTKITMAGVAMNFLVAIVIFTFLALAGMPKLVDNQFSVNWDAEASETRIAATYVEADSPADLAGIKAGDRIAVIGGTRIVSSDQLYDVTEANAGKTVDIVYERGEETQTATATLNDSNDETGYFGVSPADISRTKYGVTAPIVGVGTTIQMTVLTLQGIGALVGDLISGEFGQAADSVSGPIGVVAILNNISVFGLAYLFFFIAIISLTLAVFNALPIPALDGGRLSVTLVYHALKKKLTPRTEQLIHGTGFVVLLMLIVLISIVDVNRVF